MLMPAFIDPKIAESMPFDPGAPHVFRTCDEVAFKSTVERGVLWLRPVEYFRNLEEAGRSDQKEGLRPIAYTGAFGDYQITGDGSLDFALTKHYILSMHGCSLDFEEFADPEKFNATYTFSVRNIDLLMRDVVRFLSRRGYECRITFGQIKYQKIGRTHVILRLDGDPVILQPEVRPFNYDFFVKDPSFSGQDEWRLILEVLDQQGQPMYVDDSDKLVVEVSPTHFQRVEFTFP